MICWESDGTNDDNRKERKRINMGWRAVQGGLFDDPAFCTLTEHAQLLYLRIVCSSADSHGRCIGHPAVVRGTLTHRTIDETIEALTMLHLSDLIYWYADRNTDRLGRHRMWIQVCNWDRDQPRRLLEKRGPSRLPAPDSGHIDASEAYPQDGRAAQRAARGCRVGAD